MASFLLWCPVELRRSRCFLVPGRASLGVEPLFSLSRSENHVLRSWRICLQQMVRLELGSLSRTHLCTWTDHDCWFWYAVGIQAQIPRPRSALGFPFASTTWHVLCSHAGIFRDRESYENSSLSCGLLKVGSVDAGSRGTFPAKEQLQKLNAFSSPCAQAHTRTHDGVET